MNYRRSLVACLLFVASAYGVGLIAGGFTVKSVTAPQENVKPAKPAAQPAGKSDPCCGTVVLDDKIKKQCPGIPKNLSNNTSYSFFQKPCALPAKPVSSAGSAGGVVAPFSTDDLHKTKARFTKGLAKKTASLKQIKGKPKTDVVTLTGDNPIQIITFTPTEGKNANKEVDITLLIKNKDGGEGRNVWGAAIFKDGVKKIDNIGPFEGPKGIGFQYTIRPDGAANIKPLLDSSPVRLGGYDI